jgi:hypothetical protein
MKVLCIVYMVMPYITERLFIVMLNISKWLINHFSEILQLAAPSSVVLFILSKWWEDRKEFRITKDILLNEMTYNRKIAERNINSMKMGRMGAKKLRQEDHAHIIFLHKLSYSGWIQLSTSGKLNRFSGKNSGKKIIQNIREMYTLVYLINQQIAARELICFGPLRVQTLEKGSEKYVSMADEELDNVDITIEENLQKLKKTISAINEELS